MNLIHEEGYMIVPGVETLNDYIALAKELGEFVMQGDAEERSPFVLISEGNKINKLGFSHKGLFPHTDRSIMKNPPDLVLLWCSQPAESGGESLLVDARKVLASLKNTNHCLYRRFLEMSAIFSDENLSDFYQSKFFFFDGSSTYVRFRYDDYLYVPPKFHKDYEKFVHLIQENIITHAVKKNEVIIMNNKRMLHGRREFSGHRELYRLHVNTIERMKGCIS